MKADETAAYRQTTSALWTIKDLFTFTVVKWLGREDSNLRMPVPKTGALPLGYAPVSQIRKNAEFLVNLQRENIHSGLW
jgi:hypothetical protein